MLAGPQRCSRECCWLFVTIQQTRRHFDRESHHDYLGDVLRQIYETPLESVEQNFPYWPSIACMQPTGQKDLLGKSVLEQGQKAVVRSVCSLRGQHCCLEQHSTCVVVDRFSQLSCCESVAAETSANLLSIAMMISESIAARCRRSRGFQNPRRLSRRRSRVANPGTDCTNHLTEQRLGLGLLRTRNPVPPTLAEDIRRGTIGD